MHKPTTEELLKRYFENKLTPDEEQELMELYTNKPSKELLSLFDRSYLLHASSPISFSDKKKQKIWQQIADSQEREKPSVKHQYLRYSAVIAIVLCIGALAYTFLKPNNSAQPLLTNQSSEDLYLLQPGDATLYLRSADNDLQLLTHAEHRQYIEKIESNNTIIVKKDLAALNNGSNGGLLIQTNKGQTSKIILADKSEIWLNAGSSLSIPSLFNLSSREVSLVGEAYFEVAQQKGRPFRVNTKYNTTEVLGTHFNISAYEDAVERTTLIEGKVKVSNGMGELLLKAGEQAYGNLHKPEKISVDTNAIRAWQQGYFVFDNLDVRGIMNEVRQYYDIAFVDFAYESTDRFSGTFKRKNSLRELLDHLEEVSDTKFYIKQGGVYVIKR